MIKNLGEYTLQLQTIVNESGASTFAGKPLPSHKLRFTVTGEWNVYNMGEIIFNLSDLEYGG